MSATDEFHGAAPGAARGMPAMFQDVLVHLNRLVRQEAALARAEVSAKMRQVMVAAALLAAGAVLAIPALVLLLQAGAAALAEAGFSPTVSALIAGGCALVVALVLVGIGLNRIQPASLFPERTARQLSRDLDVMKEQLR